MKKIIFLLVCIYFCCGCSALSNIENNLTRVSADKGNELPLEESDSKRALSIKENILNNMNELEAASVVVESRTALIGIRPKQQFKGESLRLKEEAEIWAKRSDSSITGASVTTNEHIITMIKDLERQRQK